MCRILYVAVLLVDFCVCHVVCLFPCVHTTLFICILHILKFLTYYDNIWSHFKQSMLSKRCSEPFIRPTQILQYYFTSTFHTIYIKGWHKGHDTFGTAPEESTCYYMFYVCI